MNRSEVLQKLSLLKPVLEKEGVMLLGIFGSYARGDNTPKSDIDILYTLPDPHSFSRKHGGFGAFSRLREIKDFLAKELGSEVDFVEKTALSQTGKKFILKELVDV